MSVLHCTRCAHAVDTDWDTDTLYDTPEFGPLCAECAEVECVYHPENGELYEDGWMDEVEFDDHCSRNADVGEALK